MGRTKCSALSLAWHCPKYGVARAFPFSSFHDSTALLLPASLSRQISEQKSFVMWFGFSMRCAPFTRSGGLDAAPWSCRMALFMDQFPISASSCPQHRSVAASPQRAAACSVREKRNGACPAHARSARARHWAVFHVVTQGWPVRAQLSVGTSASLDPWFQDLQSPFARRPLAKERDGKAPPLKNAPSSRARCGHPWTA